MSTIAIDTATEILSVGLESGGGYYESSILAGFHHSEYLLPLIDNLRTLASPAEDLELVICMRGPGSFTGLRIGMATAKGLATGSNCALVAVPTLDVLADGLDFFRGIVVPVIDARKQRVYTALYSEGRKESLDLDISAEELESLLPSDSPVLFTGPGSKLLSGFAASHKEWRIDPKSSSSRASSLLRLGKRRLSDSGPDPDDSGPVYLRPSEAKLSKGS